MPPHSLAGGRSAARQQHAVACSPKTARANGPVDPHPASQPGCAVRGWRQSHQLAGSLSRTEFCPWRSIGPGRDGTPALISWLQLQGLVWLRLNALPLGCSSRNRTAALLARCRRGKKKQSRSLGSGPAGLAVPKSCWNSPPSGEAGLQARGLRPSPVAREGSGQARSQSLRFAAPVSGSVAIGRGRLSSKRSASARVPGGLCSALQPEAGALLLRPNRRRAPDAQVPSVLGVPWPAVRMRLDHRKPKWLSPRGGLGRPEEHGLPALQGPQAPRGPPWSQALQPRPYSKAGR